MPQPITVSSRWRWKQTPTESESPASLFAKVCYIAADGTISRCVPQWLFLQDFQPVTERKKKAR